MAISSSAATESRGFHTNQGTSGGGTSGTRRAFDIRITSDLIPARERRRRSRRSPCPNRLSGFSISSTPREIYSLKDL